MQPIDAVISWVDGYDPIYQHRLAQFCLKKGVAQKEVVEPTRIQQCGEIEYCLRSLYYFAPWLRTIYILTDNQVPQALNSWHNTEFGKRIRVINQADLFFGFEDCLPVFNSLTIEWLLHRIKGLSSHFLYLNDDFFLTRPVNPSDFFIDDRIVLRGEWKRQSAYKWRYRLKKWCNIDFKNQLIKSNPHRHWQEQSAVFAGIKKDFYLLPHAPFPLLKSTFTDFIDQNPHVFADNLRFPFRHPNQLSPLPLMAHLDIQNQRVVFDNQLDSVMVNGACHPLQTINARLKKTKRQKSIAFLCMQSIDQAPLAIQQHLINWLENLLPPRI